MKLRNWIGFVFLLMLSLPAYAFNTVDEQIDQYLKVLAADNHQATLYMLTRLKWTAITDPRLYDEIAKSPLNHYLTKKLDKVTLSDAAHKIRALGYSGNPKYRDTLSTIMNNSPNKKLRAHSQKALVDLDRFERWNRQINEADAAVQGKSVEITTYSKMLNVQDTLVQRFAARAIVDASLRDSDLLDAVAEKLKAMYADPGLDKREQDTAAWFVKALGQSGKYRSLLTEVNQSTPHNKLKKHSIRYIQ
ncbi:MAG: hypothetical protein GY802_17245 [Gammaproteobacteria bacterium]|nr:hypothetical protein [Gammaproteobacteria bacterium]